MNQFPNQTSEEGTREGIRHGRHPRHPHRLHGGFARRGHPGHPGRGHNRRAVHELHKALAEVARTGDAQLRGEAAQIVTETTARLNGLLAADR
jgi:hypothetical protein